MRFANIEYFWLFLLVPALIAFFIWAFQQKQKALARFAQPALIRRLTPSADSSRQILKWVMFTVFFIFFVFALTRPRWGVKSEMVERRGVDVMIALDVSRSMLAEDIVPSRLDRAKHEIAKFIDLLKGDRVGLIIFAGESFVQCPLTLDYGAAKMFLEAVETDWVDLQGTALADAIAQASTAFKTEKRKYKVLLLLTDGEEHEGDAVKAAAGAAREGARIYTVGIGSDKGAPIPVKKHGGEIVYKKDTGGNLVMTRLNQLVLEQIAREGNGAYFHAATDLDLVRIYDEIAKMEEREFGTKKMTVYEERYQIFLLFALIFLLLEFFIPERVRSALEWRGRFE